MFISLTILLLEFHLFVCIVANGGHEVDDDKPFMVYLISACAQDESLCGGSLISETQILTTASCLMDVKHLYAIAGYRKFVPEWDRNLDGCIQRYKKRIVYKLVPEGYQNKTMRDHFNIGVGIVESRYDFHDNFYRVRCNYTPKPIKINFDTSIEVLKTSVLAFGWGTIKPDVHLAEFVKSNELRAASSTISDMKDCMNNLKGYVAIIRELHLLCAFGRNEGAFEPDGLFRSNHFKGKINCRSNLNGRRVNCEDDNLPLQGDPATINGTEEGLTQKNVTTETSRRVKREITNCKFDEGGPLVTWAGRFPLLIGVALPGFVVMSNNIAVCTDSSGLFISTAQNNAIIKCLLTDDDTKLSKVCKLMDIGIKKINDTDWTT